jgi:hypothetical protein
MSASRGRPTPWLWRDDEEMAKKDDDLGAHRRSGHRRSQSGGQWQPNRVPRPRMCGRRLVYVAVVAALVLAVYKALTFTSNSLFDSWPSGAPPTAAPPGAGASRAKSNQPARGHDNKAVDLPRTFNGPMNFPHLAVSVNAIVHTMGHLERNKNVLFATASLRSAATLLPMACEMAREEQNFVHFAFVGRSSIPMQELLKINGIDSSCSLITHDARPTEPGISTEARMTLASARALFYLNKYIHAQAILLDTTSAEEPYFLSGLRDQIRSTNSALIELPERAQSRLGWVAKLDAAALGAWNSVHFDILVHAPPTGTANLRRLLTSLHRVDLAGLSVPHMTIELPASLQKGLSGVLNKFQWPPASARPFSHPQMLTLNRRIPSHRMTEEERSVRFLEAFWPRDPKRNHVLVLSPHTEVTPEFLHYVKYTILSRRHTSKALGEPDTRLMSMSFTIPPTLLDATKPFTPPKGSGETSPFLWQAPASDAVLFLGSKWVELHGFVSQLLERQQETTATPSILAKKEVSKKYPAWMEHVLQLARLRGYYTLYPSQELATSVVGVHTDLSDVPEEYQDEATAKEEEGWFTYGQEQNFDPASSLRVFSTASKKEKDTMSEPLRLLSWEGEQIGLGDLDQKVSKFADEFRREVGHCTKEELAQVPATDPYAGDLFCTKKAE